MSGLDRTGGTLNDGQPVGAGWRLAGMADLNADNHTDFLWQHSSGRVAAWFMNGGDRLGSVLLRNGNSVSPGWQLVGPK